MPQLRIFLNGRQLEVRIRPASPLSARGLIALCFFQDHEVLGSIGIKKGSVLTVVGRLCGGAKPGAKRPVVPDSEEDDDNAPVPKRPAAAGLGNKPLPTPARAVASPNSSATSSKATPAASTASSGTASSPATTAAGSPSIARAAVPLGSTFRPADSVQHEDAKYDEEIRATKRAEQREKVRNWREQRRLEKHDDRVEKVRRLGLEAIEAADTYRAAIADSRELEHPVDRLESIANHSLTVGGRRPLDLSDSSRLGRLLRDPASAPLATGLCSMADNGLAFDPQTGVQHGWLRHVSAQEVELGWTVEGGEDDGDGAPPPINDGSDGEGVSEFEDELEEAENGAETLRIRPQVYLRVLELTVHEAVVALNAYARQRPADAWWADAGLAAVKKLDESGTVRLTYAGQSFRLTGAGRAAQDEEDGEKPRTRYKSFVAINSPATRVQCYQVVVPALEPDILSITTTRSAARFAVRALDAYQDLECLVIASLGPVRLNSALGGLAPRVAVDQSLLKMRDTIASSPFELNLGAVGFHQRDDSVDGGTTAARELQARIDKHVDEMLALWDEVEEDREPPSDYAVQRIKQCMGATTIDGNGVPNTVRLTKDITVEEFRSSAKQDCWYFGENGGQSAHLAQDLIKILELGNCAAPSDAKFAFVDLWSVTLKHKLIVIAIICVIRYILFIDSPCMRIYSSKVCYRMCSSTRPFTDYRFLSDRWPCPRRHVSARVQAQRVRGGPRDVPRRRWTRPCHHHSRFRRRHRSWRVARAGARQILGPRRGPDCRHWRRARSLPPRRRDPRLRRDQVRPDLRTASRQAHRPLRAQGPARRTRLHRSPSGNNRVVARRRPPTRRAAGDQDRPHVGA